MPFAAAIPLISAGIGAAGSIGGAAIGAHGAGKAGKQLRQTGIDVAHSLEKATGGAIDAGYAGLTQANQALTGGLGAATDAITQGRDTAVGTIAGGVGGANQALTDAYGRQIGFLDPYMQAGQQGLSQLQAFMGPRGAGAQPFNARMMAANDPGYQFRLNEAANALSKGGAARGASLGGGFAKALASQQQNLASSEYQNAWQRYMAGNQQRYAQLMGLTGIGQQATGAAVNAAGNLGAGMSGNLMSGAGTAANILMNSGQLLGQANLGVGSQLANTAMQGNQWIGNIGLQGAEAAGNAYAGGALGGASGQLASSNAWGQGIANAAGQIGGGLLNYYANRPQYAPGLAGSYQTGAMNLPMQNLPWEVTSLNIPSVMY